MRNSYLVRRLAVVVGGIGCFAPLSTAGATETSNAEVPEVIESPVESIGGELANAAESAVPVVAWDGSNYLVVWEDYRSGDADIWGARVTPAGVVGAPFAIFQDATGNDVQPAVAFNGTYFLVAWQTDTTYYGWTDQDVRAVRVSKTGAVLGAPFFVSRYGYSARPRISAVGSQWLVVWENYDDWDVHGARITSSGSTLDPWGFIVNSVGTDQRNLTTFKLGGQYVVAWNDRRTGNVDIFYTTVSTAGVVSDSTGIQVTSSAKDDFGVTGAASGTQGLLAWTNEGDVRGARLNAAGALIDGLDGFGIATGAVIQRAPSVASLGAADWEVAWYQKGAGWDIKTRRVTQGASLGPVVSVSGAAGDQMYPKVVRGTSNFLVVWQDGRAAATRNNDIYGRRLNSTGGLVGAEFNIA